MANGKDLDTPRGRGKAAGPFHARRHTALLVAIIAMFATRPFLGETTAGVGLFSIALFFVAFSALAIIQVEEMVGDRGVLVAERRRRIAIAWMLAVPALGERLWTLLHPDRAFLLLGCVSWLLFFAYVVWCQIRALLRQRTVTGETISMAISVYLLIGLCWTFVYIFLYVRHPDAFDFGSSLEVSRQHIFPVLAYFSMTTLATIGSGDIAPVALQARYAVIAESIMGQFYLAIMVARLVSLQMAGAAEKRDRESPDG